MNNNRRRFFKNAALMTAVGLALRTAALALGAFIAKEVGAEGIGLQTLVMTVYSFALTFATSGLGLTVTRLVASHIGEGERTKIGATLRASVVYALLFSVPATVVLCGLSGTIATFAIGDARAILPLQILSLGLIPAALSGVFSGYFVGVRRVGMNAAVQISTQIFRIILTVYLVSSLLSGGAEAAVSTLCFGGAVTEFLSFLLAMVLFFVDRARSRVVGEGAGGLNLLPVARTALPLSVSANIRAALLSLEHSIIPKRLVLGGATLSEALASFGTLHGMALPMLTYPMSPLSSFSGLLVPEFAEAEAAGSQKRLSRIAKEAISATLSYAALVSVMLFIFSEELGYTVYSSFDAGYYIAFLAPVVPLMYLDHVVDAILKGVGEQVYSMWVNIADSLLSVVLVWILIPILGISGYAVVIIAMESFNFLLSYLRLRKRIKLKVSLVSSLLYPCVSALLSAWLVRALFATQGSTALSWVLISKIVFSVAAFFAVRIAIELITGALGLGRPGEPARKARR